jgi:hypothetical protein
MKKIIQWFSLFSPLKTNLDNYFAHVVTVLRVHEAAVLCPIEQPVRVVVSHLPAQTNKLVIKNEVFQLKIMRS